MILITYIKIKLIGGGSPFLKVYQTLIHNNKSSKNPNKNNSESASFFTIPYIHNFSEKFNNVTRPLNVRISYQSLNKLNKIIKVHKDPLPDSSQSNIV